MLAKRTYKNQITLPKEILKDFAGVEYFNVSAKAGKILLDPVFVVPSGKRLAEVRSKVRSLGLTKRDLENAIRWVRRRASRDFLERRGA